MKLSEWRLRLNENVESVLNKLRAGADKTSAKFGDMQSKLNNVGNSIGNGFNQLKLKAADLSEGFGGVIDQVPLIGRALEFLRNPIVGIIALFVGLAIAIGSTIGIASEFQVKTAEFSAITGTMGNSLDYVHDKSLRLSMQSGKSANDIIDAYKLVASNVPPSLQTQSALIDEITKNAVTLQKASGGDLSQSVLATTAVMNAFKIEATDTARIVNVLAAGAQKGAAEVPDLIDSLRTTSPVAAQAKISLEELVGTIETLSPIMKGAMADTAIKNIMIDLQTKIKGVDLQGDGLAKTLSSLKPYLSDVTFLTKTFGDENLAAAQYLIANSDSIVEMTGLITGTNTAFEQAAINDGTYAASKEKMRATIDALKVTIGEKFLPILTKITEAITKLFTWIFDHGQDVMNVLEMIFKPFLIVGRAFFEITHKIIRALDALWDALTPDDLNFSAAWNHITGFFKSLVDLVSLIGGNIAEIMNPANWFRRGRVKDSIADLKKAFMDFGKSAGNGFVEGMENSIVSTIPTVAPVLADALSFLPKKAFSLFPAQPLNFFPTTPASPSLINTAGASSGTGAEELKKGLAEVSGGGRTVHNVTITIQKMVDGGIHIHSTTLKEGAVDMKQILEEQLLRTIQGVEETMINE